MARRHNALESEISRALADLQDTDTTSTTRGMPVTTASLRNSEDLGYANARKAEAEAGLFRQLGLTQLGGLEQEVQKARLENQFYPQTAQAAIGLVNANAQHALGLAKMANYQGAGLDPAGAAEIAYANALAGRTGNQPFAAMPTTGEPQPDTREWYNKYGWDKEKSWRPPGWGAPPANQTGAPTATGMTPMTRPSNRGMDKAGGNQVYIGTPATYGPTSVAPRSTQPRTAAQYTQPLSAADLSPLSSKQLTTNPAPTTASFFNQGMQAIPEAYPGQKNVFGPKTYPKYVAPGAGDISEMFRQGLI